MMGWEEPGAYWGIFEPKWWDSRRAITRTFGWMVEYFNRGHEAANLWWIEL